MFKLAAACLVAESVLAAGPASPQDLIDYVNTPDPAFAWHTVPNATLDGEGWTGYAINVTSQTWLTPEDFVGPNGYLWTHHMMCIRPKLLEHKKMAGIYATGGGQGSSWPDASDEDVLVAVALALESKSIVCTLFQIPNQDIQFADDPEHKNRGEDALVAYSWLRFFKHGYQSDASKYIVNLPMAKGVAAAMTAVQQFFTQEKIADIEKFLIAGASKRGWTTWLIGASDKRVVAIAPIVMDMLNFYKNVPHMPKAYGGWTFAFKDYCEANVTQYIDTPQLAALSQVVDPLNYVDQLTMPKLIIDATGDEFFMPDDDYLWWGQLKGDTYRLMTQNAEHSEATGIFELLKGVHGFYASVLADSARPTLDWTMMTNGTISAVTDTQPAEVNLWYANSVTVEVDAGRRDFRLVVAITPENPCKFIPVDLFGHNCLNPIIWKKDKLTPVLVDGKWTVSGSKPQPATGYVGYFMQFVYPGTAKGGKSSFVFTTQQAIMPNTYPFPDGCAAFIGGCGNCSAYYV